MSRLTEAQLADRRNGIGGSDIAAIVKKHPYKTARQVYAEKVGVSTVVENEAMAMGHTMEPVIFQLFLVALEKNSGRTPSWREGSTIWLEGSPVFATTDYELVIDGQSIPVECKNRNAYDAEKWGKIGSDDVPEDVAVQVHLQMAVTKAPYAYVAVLIGGNMFRWYRVAKDSNIANALVVQATKWWKAYVETKTPPPLDLLKDDPAEWFKSNGITRIVADPKWENLIEARMATKEDIADKEEVLLEIDNTIKAEIGDSEGVKGLWGTATWKPNKNGVRSLRVDYEPNYAGV